MTHCLHNVLVGRADSYRYACVVFFVMLVRDVGRDGALSTHDPSLWMLTISVLASISRIARYVAQCVSDGQLEKSLGADLRFVASEGGLLHPTSWA